jgi:predicted ATPase
MTNMTNKNFKEFVLTGGPCGGKTTALKIIPKMLIENGYKTFVVPEVPTMIFGTGAVDFPKLIAGDFDLFLQVERNILRTQMELRERFRHLVRLLNDNCVILYDRAFMDVAAYVEEPHFSNLLKMEEMDIEYACHSFDSVFHLITTADGAEDFYSLENEARFETPEEAKEADLRVLKTWEKHQSRYIIDNSTDFNGKMDRLFSLMMVQIDK